MEQEGDGHPNYIFDPWNNSQKSGKGIEETGDKGNHNRLDF